MTDHLIDAGVSAPVAPGFVQALKVWARIGCLSFGGPAAQIALMHREIVDERGWLTEKQYLNALSFCMLLPGPEAMQLATYAGWRLHGVAGGLAAGLLFVLPGAAVIMALSVVYVLLGNAPIMAAVFLGVKAAVVLIVIEALLRVARRALGSSEGWIIAGMAFIGIFFLALPFPLIVAAAGLYGILRSSPADSETVSGIQVSLPETLSTVALWLMIWWAPLVLLWVTVPDGMLFEIGIFFSKLAVVTFGGAYAVLAYMAQDVVVQQEWMTAGAMMDGLGLAETTPGPLILVTQFVGFLAAHGMNGLWFGVAGAVVALWTTFAPCFLWIFAGAPYIDWIAGRPRLRKALSCITAAVVGVILNLSLWFALHVFFDTVTQTRIGPLHLWLPDLSSVNGVAVGLSLLCAFLMFRLHWGIAKILAVSAAVGVVVSWTLPMMGPI